MRHFVFDIPDEGARALHLGGGVHLPESLHQRRDLFVVDDGHERSVHRRPGMRAVMGFAVERPATLGQRPAREAADALSVQNGVHAVGQRLVV